MARPANPNSIFNFSLDILNSSFSNNGTISLQTGSVLGPETVTDIASEIWFPPGYLARPAKATPGKEAAQGISVIRGDHDVVFAFRDIRANSLQEQIGYGEVQLYAGGPTNSGISKIVLNNDGNGNEQVTITAGTTKVQVKSNGDVIVNPATNIQLGDNSATFVALANLVANELSKIQTTLSSGATPPGGGTVTFSIPYVPGNVAATKVKAQ